MATAVRKAVPAVIDGLARLENALSPSRVQQIVIESSDDDLVLLYAQARTLARLSWVTLCIVAAQVTERMRARGLTLPDVGSVLRVHHSEVGRAVKIYNLIIKPRLEREGDDANFAVYGRGYYEIALRAAEFSGNDPEQLVRRAEEAIIDGTGYSLRAFRQSLIGDGYLPREEAESLDARAKDLRLMLQKLAAFEDDVVDYSATITPADDPLRTWAENARLVIERLLSKLAPSPE